MNNKIKELAEQSFDIIKDNRGRVEYSADSYGIEKFAELIVWECAEQSMSIDRYNTPSGVTPDLSIAIAVGLKKHFGVTE